jgi:RNA polymerase sigma-70 factor (sigma-E family)
MAGTPPAANHLAMRWTADEAVTHLFAAHYRPLVRLATLLLADAAVAEEVTADAYVGLHARWRSLRDPDNALAYLRSSVVNRSRSALRHRGVVARFVAVAVPPDDAPSAESTVLGRLRRDELIAALAGLPGRQREALILRYYADLSEAQVAAAMGCSRGAVKSHTARGLAALRQRIERSS